MMRGMEPVDIVDPDDPRLEDFLGLTDAELRRRSELEEGFFVAEGPQTVERVIASRHRLRSVLVTHRRWDRMKLLLTPLEVPVYRTDQDVMDRAVGFHLHRGIVATAGRLPEPSLDEMARSTRRLVILEGLNDQENLGAVFRSALGLGADAIVLDPTCADPYYRRTVRVSMGAVAVLPFARAGRWPDDLAMIREAGFTVAALTPDPTATPIQQVGRSNGRIAVLLGAEGPGLTGPALEAADLRVRIPMTGPMDSLNVGHAAAIAFHRLFSR